MESGSAATRGAADLVLLGDAFAVLPRAVVEGQRILAAMEATLIILLSRTFYVLLIVAGAALLALPFPMTPRQNSGLAFVTVGIPLIVLALWVPPRRSPKSLVLDTFGLSIPASAAVAVLALPVYSSALAAGAPLAESRTILTTITVFCGLGLLPLVHPAHHDPLVTGRARAWPWLLALIMAAVYAAILAIPLARDFYELVPLEPTTFLVLFGLGVGWTLVVHAIRLTGFIGRVEQEVFRTITALLRVRRRRVRVGTGTAGDAAG
jgi:cation-transporting ATPase E